MVPSSYLQQVREFQQHLEQLCDRTTQPHPDPVTLRALFLEAQQLFQTQIASLQGSDVDAAIAPKLQAMHLEVNKYLRLIGLDVMFLQTARQAITIQKRQADMRDRIQTLLKFCEAILESAV